MRRVLLLQDEYSIGSEGKTTCSSSRARHCFLGKVATRNLIAEKKRRARYLLMLIVIVNYCFRGAGTFGYLVFLSHPFVLCYTFPFLVFCSFCHPLYHVRVLVVHRQNQKDAISLLYIYCRMLSDAATQKLNKTVLYYRKPQGADCLTDATLARLATFRSSLFGLDGTMPIHRNLATIANSASVASFSLVHYGETSLHERKLRESGIVASSTKRSWRAKHSRHQLLLLSTYTVHCQNRKPQNLHCFAHILGFHSLNFFKKVNIFFQLQLSVRATFTEGF